MILLDSFVGGILLVLVAIIGIYAVKLVVGLIMHQASQLTGKTFVHRGQVWSSPKAPNRDDQTQIKANVEKVVKDFYDGENKKVVAELKASRPNPLATYENSTGIAKLNKNSHRKNDDKRAELIQALVECGLTKQDAFCKAVEKYPIGT